MSASRPRPGQAKTVSVRTAPLKRAPMREPTVVTTGRRAFRRADRRRKEPVAPCGADVLPAELLLQVRPGEDGDESELLERERQDRKCGVPRDFEEKRGTRELDSGPHHTLHREDTQAHREREKQKLREPEHGRRGDRARHADLRVLRASPCRVADRPVLGKRLLADGPGRLDTSGPPTRLRLSEVPLFPSSTPIATLQFAGGVSTTYNRFASDLEIRGWRR